MNKPTEQDQYPKDMFHSSSRLFLVRVWLEKNAQGTRETRLCGRVQDVITGQAHYFRGGSELAKVLHRMIPSSAQSSAVARAAEHEDKV